MREHVSVITVVAILLVLLAPYSPVLADTSSPLPSPTWLSATPGDGMVHLEWGPPVEGRVESYWIYRGHSEPLALWTTLGNVTEFTDVGLVNGREYLYSVRAVNSQGPGEMSQIVSAVPMTVPSEPILPTAFPGNGYLELTWHRPNFDGGAPIIGYRVYRSQDLTLIGVAYQERFIHYSLQIGKEYSYRIAAYNIAGEGALSVSFSGIPDVPPGAPTGFTATGGVRNVSLSWETPLPNGGSPIIGYKVYRGPSQDTMTILTTLTTVNNYTDFGLAENDEYYYAVSAFNSAGEGERCLEVRAKVFGPPTVRITSVVEGDGRIGLFWTVDNGVTLPPMYYWVYRGFSMDNLSLIGPPVSECSIWDEGLQNGMRYYYQVAAENPSGMGWSEIIDATPRKAPSGPSNLAWRYCDGYVIISWEPPSSSGGSPVLGYKLYLAEGSGDAAYLREIASTSIMLGGLNEGARYTVMVTAFNAAGEGEFSSPLTFVYGRPPSAPTELSVISGQGYVLVSWSPPQDVGTGSVLEYVLVREEGAKTVTRRVKEVQFNDTSVTNGVEYAYYVVAVNMVGPGEPSDKVKATPMPHGSVPGTPENLTALAYDDHIFLTWQAASDGGQRILGYDIYRGLSPERLYYMTSVQETWFNDTDLPHSSTYFYMVKARNVIGTGNASNVVNATTGPGTIHEDGRGWSLEMLVKPMIYPLLILLLGAIIVILFRKGILQGVQKLAVKDNDRKNRYVEAAKRSNAARTIPGAKVGRSEPKRPKS